MRCFLHLKNEQPCYAKRLNRLSDEECDAQKPRAQMRDREKTGAVFHHARILVTLQTQNCRFSDQLFVHLYLMLRSSSHVKLDLVLKLLGNSVH